MELTRTSHRCLIAEIAALVAEAVTPAAAPSDDEARAYEALAAYVLGPAARQNPPEVQVTRVERAWRSARLADPEPGADRLDAH